MGRCRVVQPETVRLFLADVHRRAYQKLKEQDKPKAKEQDLAIASAAVTRAEADGDWLIVKKRLNHGELSAAHARMYLAGVDGSLHANPLQIGMAKVTAYLLDWSLTDPKGDVIPIRDKSTDDVIAALNSIDPESFGEIREAIAAHEEAMVAEREKEKKIHGGEQESSAISPSRSEHAGPSATSVS